MNRQFKSYMLLICHLLNIEWMKVKGTKTRNKNRKMEKNQLNKNVMWENREKLRKWKDGEKKRKTFYKKYYIMNI